MSRKKTIAIIPARAGSKGLSNKNIMPLNGKPLILYSIEAAQKSGCFENIIVSTDSEQIASIARIAGAEVPFIRPEELATDSASSVDVVLHLLKYYEEQNFKFDDFMLLQPTSPLRAVEDIQNAIRMKSRLRANSIVSVCEAEHSPKWMGTLPPDLSMDGFAEQLNLNKRRQMLETHYRLNGAIYLCDVLAFKASNAFIMSGTYALIMPQERSVDIDVLLDFQFAAFLMKCDS